MNDETGRPSSDPSTLFGAALESAKYVRQVLHAADVGAWRFDRVENHIYFDAPARDMLRLGERSVSTLSDVLAIVHPEDRDVARHAFETALDPTMGGLFKIDIRVGGDDIRWIRSRGRVLFDHDGSPKEAFGVVRDVSRHKELEFAARSLVDANVALQEEIDRTRSLEKEVLKAADEERSRIARELHDGLQQQLTGMSLLLIMIERDIRMSRDTALERVQRLRMLLEDASEQIRDLSRRLTPFTIREHGLIRTLEKLFLDLDAVTEAHMSFEAAPDLIVGFDETATHVYRIAQEATNNAIKHAHANRIRATLQREGNRAVLTVEDDGIGFDISSDRATESFGVRTMSYRADLIAGSLEIKSKPNEGTLVCCTFPLT